MNAEQATSGWTFITNHGAVLLFLAEHPDSTVKAIAGELGLGTRTVIRLIADLETGGYLTKQRLGRRNRYRLDVSRPLRHRRMAHLPVSNLLKVLGTHVGVVAAALLVDSATLNLSGLAA
ncbi:MAG: winged helix-turn-helix transcriptional regulator [Chloroflexi bacterium]|nr:winged helix-turn-helix transcriptional regulator [Chloroflexota bacterium]